MSWTLRELFKNYREITHSTQGLLAEQLKAKMLKEDSDKEADGNKEAESEKGTDGNKSKSPKDKYKEVGIVNNIEQGKSLKDNTLYNAVLKKFFFVDTEKEMSIIEDARELANDMITGKVKLDIKRVFGFNSTFELAFYLSDNMEKYSKNYVDKLLLEFLPEISIDLYEYKTTTPQKLMDLFSMNETAKFLFYTVFFYLLMGYKYNAKAPYFSKEDTQKQDFDGIAKAFGYNWKDLKTEQIRSRALKSINEYMGLYNHLLENEYIKEYFKLYDENEETFEKTFNSLIGNDDNLREIADLVNGFNNNEKTPEFAEKAMRFITELELNVVYLYIYYQGYCFIPNFKYFDDMEDKIQNLALATYFDESEIKVEDKKTIENHLDSTKQILLKHLDEARSYLIERDFVLDTNSWNVFYYKTSLIRNTVKHAKLDLINLRRLYWHMQA